MSLAEYALLLPILLPLAGAVVVASLDRHPNLRDAASLMSAAGLAIVVAILTARYYGPGLAPLTLPLMFPGLRFALSPEPLGLLFALLASCLWLPTTLYAIGYMRGNKERAQTRFFTCFALAIACAMGMAFSGNLLTLFLFYEAMTVLTYPLVTHAGTPEAYRAGRVYLGVLMGSSLGLQLPGLAWLYHLTGTLDFTAGGILIGKAEPWEVAVLLFLLTFGFAKAAIMPLHKWLPAAMVAPTPVSALLHAVAVVKAGVFSIVKVVLYIFGPALLMHNSAMDWRYGGWLVYAGGGTVLLASLIALRQDNLKRRLAYSTVSQLSYVVMAAALFTPLALKGAIFHILAHALGKITLFFGAGSLYTAGKLKNVSQLDGAGRAMPWTMGAFAIGALSMIGVPPAAGFISKWFMLQGTLYTEHYFVLGVLILSTLLNAAYFLPILTRAFFRPLPEGSGLREAPWTISLPLTLTASAVIGLFLWPEPIYRLIESLNIASMKGAG